jgi:hypothetical protein
MPNIQQPETRRSGKDPLVQDSDEINATSYRPGGRDRGTGPFDRTSDPRTDRNRHANANLIKQRTGSETRSGRPSNGTGRE